MGSHLFLTSIITTCSYTVGWPVADKIGLELVIFLPPPPEVTGVYYLLCFICPWGIRQLDICQWDGISRSMPAIEACIALKLRSSGEESQGCRAVLGTLTCVCTSTYTLYTQQIRLLGIEYKGANFPLIGSVVLLFWVHWMGSCREHFIVLEDRLDLLADSLKKSKKQKKKLLSKWNVESWS